MKKILVTGAGGFIGSHLTEHLIQTGNDVTAFIHYNSKNNWGWLEESPHKSKFNVVLGDLRDYDSIFKAMKNVDQVYHLGALIGIPYSYESPLAYIRTNVEGTYNILEAAKNHQLEKVLVTSTSEVYGTAQYTPIDENHPLQPQSPYSASKISADNISLSYYNSFKLPVVVARPFNTYGPRQSARAIIPTIISQVLKRTPKIQLGNLEPFRDFTYVEDTAKGLVQIAKEESFVGKTVNIGTGEGVTVEALFNKICELIGHKPVIVQDEKRQRPATSEVYKLLSNNTLLKSKTSWKQTTSLDAGLKQTIAWISDHIDQFKTELYNV